MLRIEDLNEELIIEEPLNKVNEQINKIDNKVVVLGGGRGIGKSMVLLNRTINNAKKDISTIYTQFDACDTIDYLKPEYHEHYIELMMTRELLTYIGRKNEETPVTFAIQKEKSKYMKDLVKYINEGYYTDELDIVGSGRKLLNIGDFSKELISKISKNEPIELLIDRFDWSESSNKSFQKGMEKYFELFDRVVLTTDDENYSSNYPLVTLDYSKDMHIVSAILSKIVMESKTKDKALWLDFLHNQTIQKLILRSNGNLKTLISTLNSLIGCVELDELNDLYVLNKFIDNIDKDNETQEKMKKMDAHPPKFHI